jgi:hypothetical protein
MLCRVVCACNGICIYSLRSRGNAYDLLSRGTRPMKQKRKVQAVGDMKSSPTCKMIPTRLFTGKYLAPPEVLLRKFVPQFG